MLPKEDEDTGNIANGRSKWSEKCKRNSNVGNGPKNEGELGARSITRKQQAKA